MKRVFLKETVYEVALQRIRWLFDEFPNILVACSGGKDSTVLMELALIVATEKKRLPLRCFFIDQELEWQGTIDYMRRLLKRPGIQLDWYQIPIKIINISGLTEPWLYCWEPSKEDKWMRPKEPDAIKENIFGTDRFYKTYQRMLQHLFPKEKACILVGLRADENPTRRLRLTFAETYKGETWGKRFKKDLHYQFYPLYDWSYRDVWKAMFEHRWDYNELYNRLFQYGMHVRDMRVSALTHELGVQNLFILQEIEPETYEKCVQRIQGIDMAAKLSFRDYIPSELPPMFSDWREYRDYLLEHLIKDADAQYEFRVKFAKDEQKYSHIANKSALYRMHVSAVLRNDHEFTFLSRFDHVLRPTGKSCALGAN